MMASFFFLALHPEKKGRRFLHSLDPIWRFESNPFGIAKASVVASQQQKIRIGPIRTRKGQNLHPFFIVCPPAFVLISRERRARFFFFPFFFPTSSSSSSSEISFSSLSSLSPSSFLRFSKSHKKKKTGASPAPHLDPNVAGYRGFDPLGLSASKSLQGWLREGEFFFF